MCDIAASDCSVSVTRVSDAHETQFSFAMRTNPTAADRFQSRRCATFLRRRLGYDVHQMCLSFIGYEGTEGHVAEQRKKVGKIVKRHGGAVHRLRSRGPV